MNTLLLAGLDALSLAMLLFVLSAGLSITFGLMRILNMAHTSFYLLGGYLALTVWAQTRSFWLAVAISGLAMGSGGVVLFGGFLRRFSREDELPQALLTFGMLLILADAALLGWGGDIHRLPPPDFLQGGVDLGPITYPRYRLFLGGIGLVIALALWLFVTRTRLGAIVRAGVDDAETAQSMGINIPRVSLLVFAAGSALAGVAGVLGGPYLGVYPGLDFETMLLAFAVVIVGGAGSIEGAFVAALLVGLVDTLAKTYAPSLAYFSIYVPMVIILAFRPGGLLGRAS